MNIKLENGHILTAYCCHPPGEATYSELDLDNFLGTKKGKSFESHLVAKSRHTGEGRKGKKKRKKNGKTKNNTQDPKRQKYTKRKIERQPPYSRPIDLINYVFFGQFDRQTLVEWGELLRGCIQH